MQKRGLGSALTILIIIAITLITAVSVYILQEEVLLSPKDKNLNLQEAQPRPNYIIQFTEETVLERLKADKDKNKAIPQKDKVEKQQKKFVKDFPEIRVGHRYQNVYNGISVYLTEEQIAQIKDKNYIKEIYPVREGKLDVIESIPNIRADKAWVLNQNLQTERCGFFSDVNLDGNVNLIDFALVKSKNGCTNIGDYNYNNDAACFRSDVNRDGQVNTIDMALVKSQGGKPLNEGECLSGKGITVGVLDSGVDYTHQDLGGCQEILRYKDASKICQTSPCIADETLIGMRYESEYSYPNTVDFCGDGDRPVGPVPQTFDNSIEKIEVTGSGVFAKGQTVSIAVTASCYYPNSIINLVYKNEQRDFEVMDTGSCSGTGLKTFNFQLTLDNTDGYHIIRAVIDSVLPITKCGNAGSETSDTDDIILEVNRPTVLPEKCTVIGGYRVIIYPEEQTNLEIMDDNGHGTHVASTIAGNGVLKGVAPKAKIYVFKVSADDETIFEDDVIEAIDTSYDLDKDGFIYGINPEETDEEDILDIISMSFTSGYTSPSGPVPSSVDTAFSNGVVVVASAGNSGAYDDRTILEPGLSRDAITVGASFTEAAAEKDFSNCIDTNIEVNDVTCFSSRGPVLWSDATGSHALMKPDIVAPGVSICAAQSSQDITWQRKLDETGIDTHCIDTKHLVKDGTSMSAPHVTGVVALIKQARPDFSPEEIKMLLRATAVDTGAPINVQGYGRVDVMNALNFPGIPSIAEIETGGYITPGQQIDIIGTASGRDFHSYTLYYGLGIQPTEWTQLTTSTTPVENGILYQGFDTSVFGSAQTYNSLRLVVSNNAGGIVEDRNVLIPQTCRTITAQGTTITLTGDVTTGSTCFVIAANDVTIDGNGYTITGDGEGGSDYGVLILEGISGTAVRNINIKGFGYGVGTHIFETAYNTLIENSNISLNSYGIGLYYSESTAIRENNISNNLDASVGDGIILHQANNNIIENNLINSNAQKGIYIILDSSGNTIQNNEVKSNGEYGIFLSYVSNSNFLNNNVCGNTEFGGEDFYCVSSESNTGDGNSFYIRSGCAWADTNKQNCGIAVQEISSCPSTLDQPNTRYVITNDLTTTSSCLTISADDIEIDGRNPQGGFFTITGDGYSSDYGIKSPLPRTNIKIRNLNINNFGRGIQAVSLTNSLIENINSNNNINGYGIYIGATQGTNTILRNIVANGNKFGISLYNFDNGVIENVQSNSNSNRGLYLYQSGNNNFISNTFCGNPTDVYCYNSEANIDPGNNALNTKTAACTWLNPIPCP